MLSINNFIKSYNRRVVLEIPELELDHGVFWIRGQNGSGKSTLLKAMAGIIHFHGDVLLNRHISIKKQPVTYRKQVNFAEAEPVFPEFLTGKEMVKLFMQAKGRLKEQETEFLEHMKVNEYMDEPIGTYSSGMLKKLSIALAFIGNPKLILLDEPLITLDARSMKILYEWIEKKHREKVSFFLSSHQPLEVNGLTSLQEILIEERSAKLKT